MFTPKGVVGEVGEFAEEVRCRVAGEANSTCLECAEIEKEEAQDSLDSEV